jgi:dimethylaniline monooxygenase (N-oxide forming)
MILLINIKQFYLSTRRGTWIFNSVGPGGRPVDLLIVNPVLAVIQKYFSSLINWMMERELNNKFNHELYRLKPNHRPLRKKFVYSFIV